MLISEELEKSLKRAYDEAKVRKHEFIALEHLLYALTFDPSVVDIFNNCGLDIEELQKNLIQFLDNEMTDMRVEGDYEPIHTLGVQYVLQLAAGHVQSSGKNQISGANVLVALFRETESPAVYFLKQQNLSRLDVVRFLSHGKLREESPELDETVSSAQNEKAKPKKDALQSFCTNLNEKALQGKIDPMIGREKELERTLHILARRRKNNPIFVGDAGVGKTAIVEGLALRITQGKVPDVLKNAVIYALDMGGLLAGTKFRGEFEERLKAVIKAAAAKPENILFIDEIHTLIGAGAVSGGAMDAANILKPILVSGELKCMGTTTYKEYRTIFEKDHALSRRFQKVEVGEPSVDETISILKGLKKYYEEFHGVSYSDEAIEAAARLSATHITGQFLPDKAIDVIDEAGAEVKLKKTVETPEVTVTDIETMISRIAKIPTQTIKVDDKEKLRDLERDLKLLIYGQDAAVEKVVAAIQLSRSGLAEPDKPIGSFLFAGPTGVGKTELAKQLAKNMGIEFIRFDMSEYMEKHTVSRLVGSPPGYVGFDQGGLLTEAIHRNPHAVLLLDEIEKAHEDIYNILLQVMDYATLTDNNGRKSDFRNVILVMTSNSGARESMVKPIGFKQAEFSDQSLKAIEKTFSPEFRNRLTAIVSFNPLDMKVAEQIVEKMMTQVEERLKVKKITLSLDSSARLYLAEKGFDPKYGARNIKRLIESEISQPISKEILFGKLVDGGQVTVKTVEEKLVFEFEAISKDSILAAAEHTLPPEKLSVVE